MQIGTLIVNKYSAQPPIIIGLLTLLSFTQLSAQDDYFSQRSLSYENKVYDPFIHTVLCHPKGNPLALPFIALNGNNQITLSFDDFSEDPRNYSYTWVLCNQDWTPATVMDQDFLPGLQDDFLVNYDFSQSTTTPYIHCELNFPTTNMPLGISGNHLLIVYEDGDRENLILTQRFYVVNPVTTIDGQAHRAAGGSNSAGMQEVDFTVDYPGYEINDPIGDVNVTILQNGRTDNRVTDLKPTFIEQSRLVYNTEIGNTFEAGNEFRELDMKRFRILTSQVESSVFDGKIQQVTLKPDQSRLTQSYITDYDINGTHFVKLDDFDEGLIDPDYANVKFRLNHPPVAGTIHVIGQATGWSPTTDNQMQMDANSGEYQLTTLIKQGLINYAYYLLPMDGSQGSTTPLEGSHASTENNYTILVYHRGSRDRHDQLIGVRLLNTVRITR